MKLLSIFGVIAATTALVSAAALPEPGIVNVREFENKQMMKREWEDRPPAKQIKREWEDRPPAKQIKREWEDRPPAKQIKRSTNA
ncbi:hypothetical protein MMC12_001447 [Toensbergia leucococca]|nr:hypothetical protein [Toensbergia leucococca]